MYKVVRVLYVLFFSYLGFQFRSHVLPILIPDLPSEGSLHLVALGGSVLAFSLGGAIFLWPFVSWSLAHARPLRQALDKEAKFEGIWAQKVSIPTRPYALAQIIYDTMSGRVMLSGVAFDEHITNPAARWNARNIVYSQELQTLFFYADGRVKKGLLRKAQPVDDKVDVFGKLSHGPNNSHQLSGTVCDLGGGSGKPFVFEVEDMRKIPRSFVKKAIGKAVPINDQERQKLLAAYVNECEWA